ncbi:unnamed protein product [Euphydryas editha]|uniref:THAP-type domain-containing protein n=1 Tax=Euphydryas editha TaxID=104508 RepID=A0AAU9TB11_EUPED|nr:unnamed protein product [Euphydryas editha]
MGKVCAVKNCDSGRKKSSSKKNTPLSFFQATETSQRLEKWTKCLGISLKKSDYICHLHFKEEDVKSYDNIIIDGKSYIMPLIKKKLSEGALPTLEHQYVFNSESTQHNAIPISIERQQTQENCNNSKEYQQQQQQQILNIRDKGMQQAFVEQRSYNDPIHSEKPIKDLIDQIKNVSILPEFWSFSYKKNELEFMRVDPETKQIRHHIRLNHDLSITAICLNNQEITIDTKITALNDVYNYLKSVEKWPICVGTLIDIKKYSKNCKGVIIGDERYHRMQMNPRCKSCRYLRNQLLTRKSAVKRMLNK